MCSCVCTKGDLYSNVYEMTGTKITNEEIDGSFNFNVIVGTFFL